MTLMSTPPPNHLAGYDQKILDLIKVGNYERALWIAEEALEYSRSHFGKSHLETAKTMNNLAWIYDLLQRHADAERLYLQVIALKKSICGDTAVELVTTLENLKSLYLHLEQYGKAEKALRELIKIVNSKIEPWFLREAVYLCELAEVYEKMAKLALAEACYQQSAAFIEGTMPLDHPNLGRVFARLADFYVRQGKYQRAKFYYFRAYRIMKRKLSSKNPDIQHANAGLAMLQSFLPDAEPTRAEEE
jgi:tetratricopeptide (TPR) repeat protein